MLLGWDNIVQHYYRECEKYKVRCNHCDFAMTRASYANHECHKEYRKRAYESIMFLVLLFIFFKIDFRDIQLHESECGFLGDLRYLVIGLMRNAVVIFFIIVQVKTLYTIKISRKT